MRVSRMEFSTPLGGFGVGGCEESELLKAETCQELEARIRERTRRARLPIIAYVMELGCPDAG